MDEVRFEREGRVATITIERPEAMNAMTPEMYREISARLGEIDADDDIWCGIVTGTGRAFSAGADLKRMHQPTDSGGGLAWSTSRQARFDNDMACSKPLIAAVNGYCLAGGMELAEFCDIRIASTEAQFGAPEVKWSILHGYGALRLPSMVGMSDAMRLLLTGEFIDAEEALRIGLVSKVVAPEELLPEARRMADQICANGPIAVRMTKELARRGGAISLQDGLRLYREYSRLAHMTEDSAEGGRPSPRSAPPSSRTASCTHGGSATGRARSLARGTSGDNRHGRQSSAQRLRVLPQCRSDDGRATSRRTNCNGTTLVRFRARAFVQRGLTSMCTVAVSSPSRSRSRSCLKHSTMIGPSRPTLNPPSPR